MNTLKYRLSQGDSYIDFSDSSCICRIDFSFKHISYRYDMKIIGKTFREEKSLFRKRKLSVLFFEYVEQTSSLKQRKRIEIEYDKNEEAAIDSIINYIQDIINAEEKDKLLRAKRKPFLKEIIKDGITYELAYRYNDVWIVGTEYIDNKAILESIDIGDTLILKHEPENTYDPNAIAFYKEEYKIGYVKKGRFQEMIHDFTKRNEPILSYVFDNSERLNASIGFYKRKLSIEEMYMKLKHATVKLTGNTNSDMQDSIACVSESEPLEVDWDYDKEKFLVTTESGSELGYLPSNLSSELDKDKTYKGVVKEIVCAEKYGIKTTIFY